MLSSKKLRELEVKIQKRSTINSSQKLTIPDNWQDFAKLTQIRSANKITYFDPFDYQIALTDLMLQRSVAVVKSRQIGISETICSFMLWQACKNPGYLGLIFSKTQTDSSLLARRMKRMIKSLGLKTTTDNIGDIELEGMGRILFRNSSPNSGRGIESVCEVFFDECGFIENAKEILQSIAPAMQMVGDDARIFAVSTPNGKRGFYWDLVNQGNGDICIETECKNISNQDANPFKTWIDDGDWSKVLIQWKVHPIYNKNPNFLNDIQKTKKLTKTQVDQEYNLSFQESELNVFEYNSVMACVSGEFEKERDSKANYYAGLDVAWMGYDATVFIVIKELNSVYSVVHLYRAKKRTSEVNLYNISKVIDTYKPFKNLAVESNNGGNFYLESLVNLFPNQHFEAIKTTEQSKISMISRLVLAVESKVLIIPDSIIINELLNFRKTEDGKLQAASGTNDDSVMSLAFAMQVSGFSRQTEAIFGNLDFSNLLVD